MAGAAAAICGLEADDTNLLLRWLNELGEILYFPDEAALSELVVLNPQWVTQRVGAVLSSTEVKKESGILTHQCLQQLWGDIPEGVRRHLLEMMDFFDLAYRIPEDAEHRSLVVERLPENAPDYEPIWARFAGKSELRLRFKMAAMHPGIPTWFIGYTLVLEADRTYLALHHQFDSVEAAIRDGVDIIPNVTNVRVFDKPQRTADTERGAELRTRIELLERLIEAYQNNELHQSSMDSSRPAESLP